MKQSQHLQQTGSALAVTSIIITAIVVGALIYFGVAKFQEQQKTSQPTVTESTDVTPSTPIEETSEAPTGIQTYTLARERLTFDYPAEWKLADASKKDKRCAENTQNCPSGLAENVTLTSPTGMIVSIGTGDTYGQSRQFGQGCTYYADKCTQYSNDEFVVNNKKVFLVTTGYLQENTSSENFELGVSDDGGCIHYCREGIGKARYVSGNVQVYGLYPDATFNSVFDFWADQSVKEAQLILKSLRY